MSRSTTAHPGAVIRSDIMEAEGYTLDELCDALACSEGYLGRVLDGRSAIGEQLARALEANGYATASYWLKMQSKWDRGL